MKALSSSLLAAVLASQLHGAAAADVIVNQEPLDGAAKQRLEQLYRVEVMPGRYWYDKVSGAWGREGGPMAGQIHPGLPLGGPLRQDASGGRTGVVINGRELHPQDVAGLATCTGQVIPGRYWVVANGVGGYEGGPPFFNLTALCAAAMQQHGSSSGTVATRTGVTNVIMEGGGQGAVTYNGKYIMTPN